MLSVHEKRCRAVFLLCLLFGQRVAAMYAEPPPSKNRTGVSHDQLDHKTEHKIEREAAWAERIERHQVENKLLRRETHADDSETDPGLGPPPTEQEAHAAESGDAAKVMTEVITPAKAKAEDHSDCKKGVQEKGVTVSKDIDSESDSCLDDFAPKGSEGQVVAKTDAKKTRWHAFTSGVKSIFSAKTKTDGYATLAQVVVWGTAFGLSLAFPPAALAIAGGVAVAGFMISAAAEYKKAGSMAVFKKPSTWCSLFLEVGQNMLVGATGGIGAAVPAIILTADALEMAVTTYKDITPVAERIACCKSWDNIKANTKAFVTKFKTTLSGIGNTLSTAINAGATAISNKFKSLKTSMFGKKKSSLIDHIKVDTDLDQVMDHFFSKAQVGHCLSDRTCEPKWYEMCVEGLDGPGDKLTISYHNETTSDPEGKKPCLVACDCLNH